MATGSSASSPSHHHNFFTSKTFNSYSLQPLIFSPKFNPNRPSFFVRLRSTCNTSPSRCLSTGSGPPSPPDSEPPRPPGLAGKLSRFQDRVQIFFAVLFWMSLFFWSSAWGGSNSGRPNKGSRFRR